MSGLFLLTVVVIYAAFGLFYGAQVYWAGVKDGKSSQDAMKRAVLRALTKPAEVLFKTLWAMTREFIDSTKNKT